METFEAFDAFEGYENTTRDMQPVFLPMSMRGTPYLGKGVLNISSETLAMTKFVILSKSYATRNSAQSLIFPFDSEWLYLPTGPYDDLGHVTVHTGAVADYSRGVHAMYVNTGTYVQLFVSKARMDPVTTLYNGIYDVSTQIISSLTVS